MVIPSSLSIPNPHLVPDINDPNGYCQACKKNFCSLVSYRKNLINIHKMIIPLRPTKNPQQLGVPNRNDAKRYCKSCAKSFCDAGAYRRHLLRVHKKTIPSTRPIPNPHIVPDVNDPNGYCKSCKKSFCSIGTYRQHLKSSIHNMQVSRSTPFGHSHLVPDINDPNGYCNACEKCFFSVSVYRKHLARIHKMEDPPSTPIINPRLVPDINDPNGYCKACDEFFCSDFTYRTHLVCIHKMMASTTTTRFHCEACKKSFSQKYSYQHLIKQHGIIPKEEDKNSHLTSSGNIKADPDMNDPDFRCSTCQKTFSKQYAYAKHLNLIHDIWKTPTTTTMRQQKSNK